MSRFLDVYWIIYFIGYLIAVAILFWLYWNTLIRGESPVLLLAAIYGAAAGSASAFAIIVEVGGRIVLLIPATVEKLKNEGRKEGVLEGLKEGRREGRREQWSQWADWLRRRDEAAANNEPFYDPPPSEPE